MGPRSKREFERIPFRKYGYGTKAAADLLTERGYRVTTWMVRLAADRGELDCTRSPGGHRRFMAAELERYLRLKA